MRTRRRAFATIAISILTAGVLGAGFVGCRAGGAIEALPDVVWFPVREQYRLAEGPVLALDGRRGRFAPRWTFWASAPTAEAGVGRHVVVPQPNMSPPLWHEAGLYVATSEIVQDGGAHYVAFRRDPSPIDAEKLSEVWARQGLPGWEPPR